MESLGFPTTDPLYAAVVRASEAVSNLTVVASGKANKANETIMQRKPWAGG
jgi:hypothetical protein